MFRCEFCNSAVGEGIKVVKVITETRQKFYPGVNSIGWEIVSERDSCPSCVKSGKAVYVNHPSKPKVRKKKKKNYDDEDSDSGFFVRGRQRRRGSRDNDRRDNR